MQELEKILEEIESRIEYLEKIKGKYEDGNEKMAIWFRIDEIKRIKKIIRKYMNNRWIPVEKRMPTQEECKDNLFWITYDGSFGSSCKVAKCQWVFSYDENENDASYSEFYIDQSPCIYTPSQNLVKAWKIIDIPDPYRPERSDNHDGE